jgi:hypothetical protein
MLRVILLTSMFLPSCPVSISGEPDCSSHLLLSLSCDLLCCLVWGGGSPCPTMKTSQLPSESDPEDGMQIGSAPSRQLILWWSTCHPEGSNLDSPALLDSCPSCASHARLNQTSISGKRSVFDPAISLSSGSCKMRSPIVGVFYTDK